MFLSEGAIPELVSKPVRRVDTRNPSFKRLLESDALAAPLKIHPKTLQEMSPDGEMTAPAGRKNVAFLRLGSEPLA